MRNLPLLFAVIGAVTAAGPAEAARILYTYADTSGIGAAIILPAIPTRDKIFEGLNCQHPLEPLCNYVDARMRSVQPNGSRTVDVGNNYGDYGSFTKTVNGGFARLTITALADTDMVYDYADTLNRNAVLVTYGYLANFAIVQTLNCQIGGVLCSSALFDPESLQGGLVFTPRNGNSTGTAIAFSEITGDMPGTYTATSGGVTARLAIVAPADCRDPAIIVPLRHGDRRAAGELPAAEVAGLDAHRRCSGWR